jgi:hypothetical protein
VCRAGRGHASRQRPRPGGGVVDLGPGHAGPAPAAVAATGDQDLAIGQERRGLPGAGDVHRSGRRPGSRRRVVDLGGRQAEGQRTGSVDPARHQHLAVRQQGGRGLIPAGGQAARGSPRTAARAVELSGSGATATGDKNVPTGQDGRSRIVASDATLAVRVPCSKKVRVARVGGCSYGAVPGAARSRPTITQRSISARSAPAAIHSLAICRHRAASQSASA